MKRREFLVSLGALGIAPLTVRCTDSRSRPAAYDTLVVGAGVFGIWTAAHLHQAGRRVAVIDAYAPAHRGSSSGGESRVTRCGYGGEELYTEWACRSIVEWRALSKRAGTPLFHEMGVLWIHRDGEAFFDDNAKVLARHGVPFSRWSARELRARYPVLQVSDDESGFFEPRGGGLMAMRSVLQLADELRAAGVPFLHGMVAPIHASNGVGGALPSVVTVNGDSIEAEQFVFACGPWLERVCPDAMAGRLFVTRQEVVYFDIDAARTGSLPVWADLPFYGVPSLEDRGFKVANDTHGPEVDITEMSRRASPEAEAQARDLLARRFPSLAGSGLKEARVCQYANSSNGDFLVDRHPGLENVWLAGCGSGHGFKHGPALGAHLAGLVLDTEKPITRFSLASKQARQRRAIQ